jgi:multidrug resistance efflux pump
LQLLARVDQAAAQRDKAIRGSRIEDRQIANAAMQSAEARWQKLTKGYRPEEVQQAQGEFATAQAEFDLAKQNHKREAKLYPIASPGTDHDQVVAAVSRTQGQLVMARAKLNMLTAGYRAEEIAEAKAEWDRARANWEMVEAGSRSEDIAEAEARVAELKARLQEVEANLKEAVVVAPERVVVEVLAVRPGDVVAANQSVVRVLRAEDLWVKAFVPEIELGKVRLHQSVEVTCDSYPGKRFQGTVVQIASESEFTPRNVQSYDERRHQVFAIKVRVADPQGVYKSGMAAEIWLPLE